jgi:23S rRNA (adenine2503-C2)-methyltransferase
MTTDAMPWEMPVPTVSTLSARPDDPTSTSTAPKTDLLALDAQGLEDFVRGLDEKPFRAKQLFVWIHQKLATSFDDMTDLSKSFRAKLAVVAELRCPVIDDVRQSSDGTRKYQLTTWDGHTIEAVFIPHASGPNKNALCISSQVGCAMGCTFCATASMKLARHLTAGEIAGQLYAVVRDLEANVPEDIRVRAPLQPSERDDDAEREPGDDVTDDRPMLKRRRVQNLVYMGMGEPLHNFENVKASIGLITDERGQGYAARRITVSTSGLVPAIKRLGEETEVHLAISLNGSSEEGRTAVMPVTKRHSLESLLQACLEFPLKARRRITFEYVMLGGVNDTDADAHRVVALMHGQRSKVNLIPFNAHPLSPFVRPSDERVESFRDILDRANISTFVRTTRGLDIDAACGMLGAKKLELARSSSSLPILP